MNWWLLTIPVIGAFIGWITIRISITLLFRPKKPVKILGLTIQGIFPKRQPQIAQQAGRLVNTELLSFDDIEQKITSTENMQKIMPEVEKHVDIFLREKLKDAFPVISTFIGEKTINQLKGLFMSELEQIFPVVMKGYVKNLKQDFDLEQLVANKIASVPADKLEALLYGGLLKELRMAAILGGIIGFIMGIIQLLIVATVTG